MYWAHSPKLEFNIPGQSYQDHIENVYSLAIQNANSATFFNPQLNEQLLTIVKQVACFHDLGKLYDENQSILSGKETAEHLPIIHPFAGAHYLYNKNGAASFLINHHHHGMEYFSQYQQPECDNIDALLQKHKECTSLWEEGKHQYIDGKYPSLFFRIALSCIVDADHYDTSRHYKNALPFDGPPLEPEKRITVLDQYIQSLPNSPRKAIRDEFYQTCRNSEKLPGISICDGSVGIGKTTANTANMLLRAKQYNLRRLIYVQPFTSVIDQTVDTLKKSIVLPNENAEDIVTASHHKLTFTSREYRHYNLLFKGPIAVTTAVQFFETLASNHPCQLRKLHSIPGSCIYIDEVDSCLPLQYWPIFLEWMNELVTYWGCHIILGSGTLCRFWEMQEFQLQKRRYPNTKINHIHSSMSQKLLEQEKKRIHYKINKTKLDMISFIKWMTSFEGPRFVVVNTKQTAAAIARYIENNYGRNKVEHISNALTPNDRRITEKRVRERLTNKDDKDWTLIGTSCMECGVDYSFRIGFRELCQLLSLLQTGGRVVRSYEYPFGEVWSFELQKDDYVTQNGEFSFSSRVLKQLYASTEICPDPNLIKEAIRREINSSSNQITVDRMKKMLRLEQFCNFKKMNDDFNVIDTQTVTCIVDKKIAEMIKNKEFVKPQDIVNNSVNIWLNTLEKNQCTQIDEGIYQWTLPYDSFLGCGLGILDMIDAKIS